MTTVFMDKARRFFYKNLKESFIKHSYYHFFFCFYNVILLIKVMQKSLLQYGEIIFQSKVIQLFLPKCSKFHHSEMYTVYGTLRGLIFAWINFREFAIFWTFREN